MTDENKAASPQIKARIAGGLYLIVIVAGIFAEVFVRGALIVSGDAAVTAANILASEPLFRLGFAADLVAVAAYIGVTAILYELLKPVSRTLALLGACFGLAGSAVMAVNMVNHLAPLFLLTDAGYLSAFEPDQLQALARVSLRLHGLGYNIAIVFFGFHLLFLGWLILRSSFLPRFLGVLLAIAALCFLTNNWAIFLAPAFAAQIPPYVMLPSLVGEGSLALWLLVVGVNAVKWKEHRAQRVHELGA
jgi:Domain of unknown function (DUF4386)